jgi:hypothetical protein
MNSMETGTRVITMRLGVYIGPRVEGQRASTSWLVGRDEDLLVNTAQFKHDKRPRPTEIVSVHRPTRAGKLMIQLLETSLVDLRQAGWFSGTLKQVLRPDAQYYHPNLVNRSYFAGEFPPLERDDPEYKAAIRAVYEMLGTHHGQ